MFYIDVHTHVLTKVDKEITVVHCTLCHSVVHNIRLLYTISQSCTLWYFQMHVVPVFVPSIVLSLNPF